MSFKRSLQHSFTLKELKSGKGIDNYMSKSHITVLLFGIFNICKISAKYHRSCFRELRKRWNQTMKVCNIKQ